MGRWHMSDLRNQLVAGSAAGLADALLLHPFDMVKVRSQLRVGPAVGVVGEARAILHEGPLALYRGIGPVVATITPKIAIRFTAFHQFVALVGNDKSFGTSLLAGIGAGCVEAVTVVCPSEVVKIRQQDKGGIRRGQLATLRMLLRENGIASLYRGVIATTARQGIQQGCKFALFYQIKAQLDGRANSTLVDLVGGAVANSVGAVVNTPLDCVKSRIQRQVGDERRYRGILQSAALIVREEGLSALAKGLWPRLLRIAPAGALQFAVFEFAASALHRT